MINREVKARVPLGKLDNKIRIGQESLIQNIRTERTKMIDDNGSDVVLNSSIGSLLGIFKSMSKVSYICSTQFLEWVRHLQ
jgi:hypothetical protein